MRVVRLAFIVGMFGLMVLPGEAAEVDRTAYVMRSDGTMVSFPLPTSPPATAIAVEPSVVATIGFFPVGSTRWEGDRILTTLTSSGELLAVSANTGEVEVLSVIDAFIWLDADLFRWFDGELILKNGSGSDSVLFRVEPDTGQLTNRGTIQASFLTIESHQGGLFGGSADSFSSIDPLTLEVSVIRTIPQPPYTPQYLCGLSSVGGTLWYGMASYSGPGPSSATLQIGTIDPISGHMIPYAIFNSPHFGEQFFGLEVVEQTGQSAIPMLSPAGALVFVLIVIMGGMWLLLRR